jgi:hypothetical protein
MPLRQEELITVERVLEAVECVLKIDTEELEKDGDEPIDETAVENFKEDIEEVQSKFSRSDFMYIKSLRHKIQEMRNFAITSRFKANLKNGGSP